MAVASVARLPCLIQHGGAVGRVAVDLGERILEVPDALVHEQALQPPDPAVHDQAFVHGVVAEAGRPAPEQAHDMVGPPASRAG